MRKINFHQSQNQFPQARIMCLSKKLLPPNFKNLNKALNKGILSPLDRKSISTSWNKESVKNSFLLDIKTVFTTRNIWLLFLLVESITEISKNSVYK